MLKKFNKYAFGCGFGGGEKLVEGTLIIVGSVQ